MKKQHLNKEQDELDKGSEEIQAIQDLILNNRVKEYINLYKKLMSSMGSAEGFEVYSDKLRELENAIIQDLEARGKSISQRRTFAGVEEGISLSKLIPVTISHRKKF